MARKEENEEGGGREKLIKEGLRSCTVSVAVLRKCTVVHYLATPVSVLYIKEKGWPKTAAFKGEEG